MEVRHHLQLWNGRAFSELLRNPRVLIRAQEEVRQVFSGTGYVDEVDLQELKFLKEVIKETLRMHNTSRNTSSCECMGNWKMDYFPSFTMSAYQLLLVLLYCVLLLLGVRGVD